MKQDLIVILDLGSTQNTVLARDIRALGVYSEIHPHDITVEERPEIYELGYPMISVDYPQSGCEVRLEALPEREALEKFLFRDCKAEANWNMKNFIEDQVELIRQQVGDRKVLLALSGGVDHLSRHHRERHEDGEDGKVPPQCGRSAGGSGVRAGGAPEAVVQG